jgi:hypothetical protein
MNVPFMPPLGSEVLLTLVLDVVFDKRCDTCRETKSTTEFPTHRGSRDGHRTTCSGCLLSGQYQPYIESPEQRALRKRRQSKPKWQGSHREALKRYARREALRVQALKALRAAVASKRVVPAPRCQVKGCNSSRFIEAHHHSYDPASWLSVLWCCAAHHRQGHARGFIIPAPGVPAHYGLIPGLDEAQALLIIEQFRAGEFAAAPAARETPTGFTQRGTTP